MCVEREGREGRRAGGRETETERHRQERQRNSVFFGGKVELDGRDKARL